MQGPQVQLLAGELRSHMTTWCGQKLKKQKQEDVGVTECLHPRLCGLPETRGGERSWDSKLSQVDVFGGEQTPRR